MKTTFLMALCLCVAAIPTVSTLAADEYNSTAKVDSTIVTKDPSAFAGAFKPSKEWTPPRDKKALEKLNQFQDLKFGIMFNWGTQTLFKTVDQSWSLCPERYIWNHRPAPYNEETDWLEYKKAYENLKTIFNPIRFDPKRDIALIKASGARYVVVDAKHHDGFCFFDTKTTDYKITSPSCPYSKSRYANVLKSMLDNARAQGLWAGIYFSKPDWNTPYYWAIQEYGIPKTRSENYNRTQDTVMWNKYKKFTQQQLTELTTEYGKVDILWLDGGQVSGKSIDLPTVAAQARLRQPGLLVVDRVNGNGYEDYLTPEGTHQMPQSYQANAWEACMSLGSKGWAWAEPSHYMSAPSVIRYLVQATARNGNILVGVGPDYNGEMAPRAIQVLDSIGCWLKINGEAIFNTRPIAPYEKDNVYFTQKKDGTIYAIAISKDDADKAPREIQIPTAFIGKGAKVTAVGSGMTIPTKATTAELTTLLIPKTYKAPYNAAWAFKITPKK